MRPAILLVLQFGAAFVTEAQTPCKVTTGPKIVVAAGTRVEVREWGGTGTPLIFLAGLGWTSRAYDEFAPMFNNRYTVLGITRRGTPPSDSSLVGYGRAVLVGDLIAVMDSLSIRSAHVVGHSFGGDEAVWLAVTHPERVLSLTLIDSYDNSQEARTFTAMNAVDTLPEPFSSYDSSSALAYLARRRRLGDRPLPFSEICANSRFGQDGRYLGSATPRQVQAAMLAGMTRLPYERIKQPVLAFYRSDRGIEDLVPFIGGMDSVFRAQSIGALGTMLETFSAARARLRRELPQAQVIEIVGASHAIFRSDPEMLFLEMNRFLSSRQSP